MHSAASSSLRWPGSPHGAGHNRIQRSSRSESSRHPTRAGLCGGGAGRARLPDRAGRGSAGGGARGRGNGLGTRLAAIGPRPVS
ncbi:hypothetical protein SGL43_07306 [Streptomyces globisporus]|uniref:Uncharacterized protein n=1 Tax=Streptomyces globisporus TaxID=1908 RepID=A0ABM9H9A3_STRGL|nr:hypothetical protein SGL43_07306 [Streptomyces globisporus]